MDISAKQKEKVNIAIRFLLTTVGGAVVITFIYLTLLTNLIVGVIFVLLMFIVGIIIGLYSIEIHYAVISGFLSIFTGLMILFGTVFIAVVVLGAWTILDIITLLTIDIVVRTFMLQLLGILPGVVVGRLIGPEWLEPKIRHKLKVGLDSQRESDTR
jgi:hypothetical protein